MSNSISPVSSTPSYGSYAAPQDHQAAATAFAELAQSILGGGAAGGLGGAGVGTLPQLDLSGGDDDDDDDN